MVCVPICDDRPLVYFIPTPPSPQSPPSLSPSSALSIYSAGQGTDRGAMAASSICSVELLYGFGRRRCELAVGEAIACNGPSPTTPARRQGSTAVKEQGSTAGAGDEVPRARGGTNGGDPLDPGRGRVRSSLAARLAARPRRARSGHRRRRTTRGRIDGVGSGAGGPVLELALTWILRRSSRRPPPSLALPPRGPGGILGGRRAGVGLTLDDSASEMVELRGGAWRRLWPPDPRGGVGRRRLQGPRRSHACVPRFSPSLLLLPPAWRSASTTKDVPPCFSRAALRLAPFSFSPAAGGCASSLMATARGVGSVGPARMVSLRHPLGYGVAPPSPQIWCRSAMTGK
jgi:hypothetical protein